MNLDSYIERQDRTFDTFRTKFSLVQPKNASVAGIDPPAPVTGRDRTTSSATFRDFLISIDQDEPEIQSPREPSPSLSFTPRIRRLDVAPWEKQDEALETQTRIKTTKKSRQGIFSKLIRRSTRHSKQITEQEAYLEGDRERGVFGSDEPKEAVRTGMTLSTKSTSDVSNASSIPEPVSLIGSPVVALGKPLGAEVGSAIAFGPVDPNILYLRQPIGSIAEEGEYKVMKPSLSTPQIQYELESPGNQKDRMSRMFDGLQFS